MRKCSIDSFRRRITLSITCARVHSFRARVQSFCARRVASRRAASALFARASGRRVTQLACRAISGAFPYARSIRPSIQNCRVRVLGDKLVFIYRGLSGSVNARQRFLGYKPPEKTAGDSNLSVSFVRASALTSRVACGSSMCACGH